MALPVVVTETADTAAMLTILPPVTLPVATNVPGVVKLPAAVLLVTFNADTTLPLRLNPAAFKLPPVILPVTLTVAPVCVVALTLAPPNTLPPVMLPLALTLAALTAAAVIKLPPVMLPVATT